MGIAYVRLFLKIANFIIHFHKILSFFCFKGLYSAHKIPSLQGECAFLH